MRAKYLLQVHPLVFSEDLPSLSKELQSDFERLFKPILQLSPNDGGILSCHKFKGKLKGHHSLEITYNNQEYRVSLSDCRLSDPPVPSLSYRL